MLRDSRHGDGQGLLHAMGTGVITGAADDDPSAIGTYASAGARFGLGLLWIAPLLLPMMYAVVYLSAKIGQVCGQGLFAAIRDHYPRTILFPMLVAAVAGNAIEAAADLGGIAAALNIFIPVSTAKLVTAVAAIILSVQYFGSYFLLRRIFRWLALALFAYVGAAVLARPDPVEVLHNTFIPHFEFTTEYLSMLVACMGTSLSAYIYTWESNQVVEEKIAAGRRPSKQTSTHTQGELKRARRDVVIGMTFSNAILYCILLSTGTTLHSAGITDVDSAAQAARALTPLAGHSAGLLFALGIVGVGFLSVPIMTTGAAYDLVQCARRKGTLHAQPREAKLFYATIAGITSVAVGLNYLGLNPLKALVWSGIVQGFSVPPLLLLIMLLTNRRDVMGENVNGKVANVLGWTTTTATFGAAGVLLAKWVA
jgi:Mn2+/Fe2+ NRAMP family transporter